MASRTPLYINSENDLQAMTGDEIVEIQKKMIYAYASDPTVVLTQVSSSGANIDSLDDTRLQAGATSQSASAFPSEGTTAEPGTVTVTYDKINLAYTTSGVGQTSDTGTTFPAYYDDSSSSVQSMTLTDVKDTFVYPAIDLLISGTESATTGGTYTITDSATAASDYTKVSASDTPIYIDTRADTTAYANTGIPETLDQPTTVTSYYLHKRDAEDHTPSRFPLVVQDTNDLQAMSASTVESILGDWLRYEAANSTSGYKLLYTVASSGGNTRGTAMVDTKLDGSGNYQTYQVGDDYRAQEFPNGSVATIATKNLRINKS